MRTSNTCEPARGPRADRSPASRSGPPCLAAILATGLLLAAILTGCAENAATPVVRPGPSEVHIGPDPEFADLAVPAPFPHADVQKVLDAFVDEEGRVEYVSLKWADEPLRRYLAMAAKVAPKDGADDAHFPDADHRLAYWINVYNAAVLAAVCRFYPIQRPDEVRGLFTRVTFRIGGSPMSLDGIEAAMRRQFPYSWRAGFALCRATTGSPKLADSVYPPKRLAHRLEEQFSKYLETDEAAMPDAERKVLKLSPVFEKYAEPMRAEVRQVLGIADPSLRDVLRRHADARLSHRVALGEGYTIRFEADGRLNDRDYDQLVWTSKDPK